MNCLAIEQHDGLLIVDCGVGFPGPGLGIDLVHPDFSWLHEQKSTWAGIVLTHGHEDHIGALPFLLKRQLLPIWGSPYTLALVRRRLAEHPIDQSTLQMHEIVPGQEYALGPFSVEPIEVAHSIVEATALKIDCAVGTVLHTGDFCFDPEPLAGPPTDVARLEKIGDEGVALLLSDSTNIDVPKRTNTEKGVAECLERLVAEAEHSVYVTTFSSNLHRIKALGDIAQRYGRKLCLLGRSLIRQAEIALKLGHLKWPSGLLVSPEAAARLPRRSRLVITGGSQAEPHSAMRRLASRTHRYLRLEAGDTVVVSSRIIPGNDVEVVDMMGDLLALGVHLRSRHSDPEVHTSGHASRAEQQKMLELIRPDAFVPVHGTAYHLYRHADLAREFGAARVLVTTNGFPVTVGCDGLVRGEELPHGRVAIAPGGHPMDAENLAERQDLACRGLITVQLKTDAQGQPVDTPEFHHLGVANLRDDDPLLKRIGQELLRLMRVNVQEAHSGIIRTLERKVRQLLERERKVRPRIEVYLSSPDGDALQSIADGTHLTDE